MDVDTIKKTFNLFLTNNRNKRFAISTHERADLDSLASAYGLSHMFPKSQLVIPDELNESASLLAEKLEIDFEVIKNLNIKDFDGLIVADTSAYALLKDAKKWKIALIVDHHASDGKDMQGELEIIDSAFPSCSELVASLISPIHDKKVAFALAVGIVSDTARFKNATITMFETLAELMKTAGVSYKEILNYAEAEPPPQAKISIIKAFQRVEYQLVGEHVIATSETGSNEGDAAARISDVADVVFVANWKEKEKECRISSRARRTVGFPLNELMKEVAVSLGGNGGGHAKAAGAAIPNTKPAVVLERCVDAFKKWVAKK